MFWRAWRLFAPDDSGGVDATDLCPSPNPLCLDDLEFVLRFGLIVALTRYLHSTGFRTPATSARHLS
jgi:hypothetical protein